MKTVKDGNVLVELWREETSEIGDLERKKQNVVNQHQGELQQLYQRRNMLLGLGGLGSQVGMVEKQIQAVKQRALSETIDPGTLGYHEITTEEMEIWRVWLSREYETRRELEEYSFDQIPNTALSEWEMAKTLGLFQTFTIRTPEAYKQQDPILIGWFLKWVGDSFKKVAYLIARWGESLRPSEEIELLVVRSSERAERDKRYNVRRFIAGVLMELIIFWSIRSTVDFFNQSESDFLPIVPGALLMGGFSLSLYLVTIFFSLLDNRFVGDRCQFLLNEYRQHVKN